MQENLLLMHERRPLGPAFQWKLFSVLTPCNHLLGSPAIHVGLIEYCVRPHVGWPGGQHLLLAVNQIACIKCRQLKPMSVRNRIGWTSLDAISAKDTPVIVDVIDLGVAFGAAYAVFRSVIGGFDINAIRGTVGGAEEASYAFLQPVLIALQYVSPTKAGLDAGAAQWSFTVGIILHGRGLEHLHEGDAHALRNRGDVFQYRHSLLV
jgi:hypothetical protein